MLASMVKTGTNAQFAYDHNGLRIKKAVNGVTTNYTLNGKNIVHMTQGSNDLHFYYDAQNKPAMVRFNGVDYFYVYDLQGDVVAMIDVNGTQVVEYHYDAWGAPISKTGTMAATLGTVNPFRYRGYVYDEETGLYYLNSRFYSPILKRYINTDVILGVIAKCISHNAFFYCSNSPVSKFDATGTNEKDVAVDYFNAGLLNSSPVLEPIQLPQTYLIPAPTPIEMPSNVRAAVEGAGFTPLDGYEYSSSYVNGNLITVAFTKEISYNFLGKLRTAVEKDTVVIAASVDRHWKIGDWYEAGEYINNTSFGDFLNAVDAAAGNPLLSLAINVINLYTSLNPFGDIIKQLLPKTKEKPTTVYEIISRRKELLN